MTQKELLLTAFKSLDFEALHNLLDDNRSYMDVPKDLFLSTLKQNIEEYGYLSSYEEVIEGTCNSCNKKGKAYKFKANNFPSLNLFFKEKKGKIEDIYLCSDIRVEKYDMFERNIYFSFYEEEKVNFKPKLKYHIKNQKIEKAIEEFYNLESMGLVPVKDLAHWFKNQEDLGKKLKLMTPFLRLKYKSYSQLEDIYQKVYFLIHNYHNNEFARKGLAEYHEINNKDEKSIVKWLLKNDQNYFFALKKTENWKNTGILILETEPQIIVDCSDCLDSFLFGEIYEQHHNEIMDRYEPTEEHYEQNGGPVINSLQSFLTLHNKYLDLLEDSQNA